MQARRSPASGGRLFGRLDDSRQRYRKKPGFWLLVQSWGPDYTRYEAVVAFSFPPKSRPAREKAVSNDSQNQDPAPAPEAPVDAETGDPPVKRASLIGMAASFTASMAKFAASGFQVVDQEIHDVRMAECEPCKYRETTRCTLCGCFIDKKAWLPHEDCPLGRWPT